MLLKSNFSFKVNIIKDKKGKYSKIKSPKKEEAKRKHDISEFIKSNFETNLSQKIKIENKNNKDKINFNNLTLDLSNEDISNININENNKIRSNISSFKLNDSKIYPIINPNELISFKIDSPIESPINIDEESKSYIKDIIDLCKNVNFLKKNLFKPKKEYYIEYNINNNVNRLKTEDLMEIVRKRKEKFNLKRKDNHWINNSIKYLELQTEKNRYKNTENNIDIPNYDLTKNKTNRIINEKYYSNINKNSNSKYTSNKNKYIKKNKNINIIKNHLFYLYKNNAKKINNFTIYKFNNNEIKKNKSLNLSNKNKISSFSRGKDYINYINKIKNNKIITSNKRLSININSQNKNSNYYSNNNNSKIKKKENENIKIEKIKGVKGVKQKAKNNPLKSDENNKCSYMNNSPSKFDIKNPNIFYQNKKSNTKCYYIFNIKKDQINNKNKIIINKSTNYLSLDNKSTNQNLIGVDNKYMNIKKGNLYMFKKIYNTNKECNKNKEICKSSINNNNDIIIKKFLKKSYENRGNNILKIKQLKIKANESLRKKTNNYNENNRNKNKIIKKFINE